MTRIWRGPLDDVWVEDEPHFDPEWVRLRSVWGTNEGLIEHIEKAELAERFYEVASEGEARSWIESIVSDLDRQRDALLKVKP